MIKQHNYYVYIMTNSHHSVFYTGVTSCLPCRTWQHKNKIGKNSFTKRYNINKLVYFEYFDNIESAISREKQLKEYSRRKKVILINQFNPQWSDLSALFQ